MVDLAFFTTHPIQYQVPWLRALDARREINLTVYYDRILGKSEQGRGFDVEFTWDLPLLEGYQWKVYDRNEEDDASTFRSLRQANVRADAVLIGGWQTSYLRKSAVWAKLTGTPAFVRGDSNALKLRPVYVRALHRGYLTLFDRYLYVGKSNRKFYQQYGVGDEKLHRCPRFVENERFDEQYQSFIQEKRKIRASFEIDEGETCFLFCGKFVPKKRPLHVLRAFRPLAVSNDHSVHLLMVGSGEKLQEAKDYARRHELNVTFTGFLNQSEIGRAYTAADVLLLPSDYGETWGLVVNEAMVFECPAIVSDRVGCGPDLVDDGETGYLFPFGAVDALTDRMRRMAESPDRRRKMGENARERVLSEYSIGKAVEGTIEALQAVQNGEQE